MGVPILILGPSGSGKSTSMRNLKAEEVSIFNVAGKPLPFKGNLPNRKTSDYKVIIDLLKQNNKKMYVIDDAQYLMAFEQIAKVKDQGYTKYTQIALDFISLINTVINNTTEDTIVYFLQHTEVGDDGRIKGKTVGKMIDNWITLEGLFSIVLLADVERDKHIFYTQSDGTNTCKSPMGMFEYKIDNDLAFVDKAIREYYDLGGKK